DGVWTLDGLPAEANEFILLLRNLFKELVLTSTEVLKEELDGSDFESIENEAMREKAQQLLLATQNMAQKVVSHQEEIQNSSARDLHGDVIADIMTLKRSMTGDRKLSETEVVEILDQVCGRIREICHDLAPRDLKDWGLQTVIEDLLERLGERTGADCTLHYD